MIANDMKIYLVFIIPLILASTVSGQVEIRAMTYNIRLDHEGDNEDNWHHRKKDMVDFIAQSNPDFLGIQEALYHQLNFLDSMLYGYSYIGVGRDDGHLEGEFMAIFYDNKRWDLIQDSTVWLSESPDQPTMGWDAACYRTCTYGRFENRSGRKVSIYNTHFDHIGEKARINSVNIINKLILNTSNEDPVVLMGDFNVEPSDTVYQVLSTFLSDAALISEGSGDLDQGTFNGFNLDNEIFRRIDFIFVDRSRIKVKHYKVPTPKTKNARQVSDHFPVFILAEIN